ncbi:MAG: hypothetical protein AAB658_06440, partial [Chloroflexota bacterium]
DTTNLYSFLPPIRCSVERAGEAMKSDVFRQSYNFIIQIHRHFGQWQMSVRLTPDVIHSVAATPDRFLKTCQV